MKKNVIFFLIILSGGVFSGCVSQNPTNTSSVEPLANETTIQPFGSPSQQSEQDTFGQYVEYDPQLVKEATKTGKAILFFHAKWCPTCKVADQDIRENLNMIPIGVTIFQTDYDTYTDLEKKYGVTYQHTFVQIDAQGNEVAKWNGGGLDEIVANIR